jgi:UDP-N-acetylglucosamine 2-epimerase (non-hydrolysing)
MTIREVHLVGGTPSETVRLSSVAAAIRDAGLLRPILIATGPGPEADLTVRVDGAETPAELLTAMVGKFDELWAGRTPAAVIVPGDTTISLAGALAAYWRRIPVVHLEAGLRSGDLDASFPEEANRRLVAQLTALHLVPTPQAAMNLLDENIFTGSGHMLITGNTAVDAALAIVAGKLPFENEEVAAARAAADGRRLVVVTAEPVEGVLAAVRRLIYRYADLDVILPSDPTVRARVDAVLGGVERVTITDPLSYPDLTRLIAEAYLVLTDSSAIQEVAPSFGVPVLVLRDVTERVESVRTGCARLVGTAPDLIVKEASELLDSRVRRNAMTAGGNPYGDGLAARRAAQATAALLGMAERPEPMPSLKLTTMLEVT